MLGERSAARKWKAGQFLSAQDTGVFLTSTQVVPTNSCRDMVVHIPGIPHSYLIKPNITEKLIEVDCSSNVTMNVKLEC